MRILQVVNDMHRKRCIIARFVATDFSPGMSAEGSSELFAACRSIEIY